MRIETEFEKFTQRVYYKLLNNTILKPIKVQHDVKMKGKSGCMHQIDVYWEYEKDGEVHRVAVECKNYKSHVPIGKVRDFFGVLSDLENVEGIMVSSKGFQKGAMTFAKQYDIQLKELSKPDRNEIIGSLNLIFHTDIRNCLYKIDEDWAKEKGFNIQAYRERMAMVLPSYSEYLSNATHVPMEVMNHIIKDSEGKQISSIEELEKQVPKNPKPGTSEVFPLKDAWIECRGLGPVKIQEVKFEYQSEVQERVLNLAAEDFVEGILKDAMNDEKLYVPKY